MRTVGRIICFLTVLAICFSLVGGLGITALAATYNANIYSFDIYEVTASGGLQGISGSRLVKNKTYTLVIESYDERIMCDYLDTTKNTVNFTEIKFNTESGSEFIKSTTKYTASQIPAYAEIKLDSANEPYIRIVLPDMRYSPSSSGEFKMSINDERLVGFESGTTLNRVRITCVLDATPANPDNTDNNSNNNNSGNNSGGNISSPTTYTSEIIVESVSVTNSAGQKLDRVTKDSEPFNVSILYSDYGKGLNEIDFSYLYEGDSLEVFLTNAGSFVPASGNRGTIRYMPSSSGDVPRFRVEFKNITWDGASNSLQFQPRYNIDGMSIPGAGGSVAIFQARAATEEDKESDIPPPTPYIIISQYSFGDEDIEAGSSFTLDVSFKNTSDVIPLENIVMTITTPDDLSIAMASNTYYIDSLGAGSTLPYSIELGVKPNASVGSHSVQIAFTYQYLSGKERKENKTAENIAIPVTQIDRFSVDPITEIPAGFLGEAAYIPISFINRGKSATYNITGTAKANLEVIVQPSHYGNLEPGKSDSIDITIVPQEPGELFGEIIVQYEDENTNQKEISIPFTMFVEQPYKPDFSTPPPDFGIVEPPQPNRVPTIALCIAGGLMMAAPIMLYLIKRMKFKGSEDFDEGF